MKLMRCTIQMIWCLGCEYRLVFNLLLKIWDTLFIWQNIFLLNWKNSNDYINIQIFGLYVRTIVFNLIWNTSNILFVRKIPILLNWQKSLTCILYLTISNPVKLIKLQWLDKYLQSWIVCTDYCYKTNLNQVK